MTSVWWIRRDLRLHDNPALTTAAGADNDLLCLFILDPSLLRSERTSHNRVEFMLAGLSELDERLKVLGNRLVVRRGEPRTVLGELQREHELSMIVAEGDHTPYAQSRDREIGNDLPLRLVGSSAIREPGLISTRKGGTYHVFSPFRDAWRQAGTPTSGEVLAAPASLPPGPATPSLPLPIPGEYRGQRSFPAGEQAGLEKLERFLSESVSNYMEGRDRLDQEGTSRLSPYFHFGMVSPRLAAAEAEAAKSSIQKRAGLESINAWMDELIWRDFYLHILDRYPLTTRRDFRPEYKSLAWESDRALFNTWENGETGYPVIDAGMRQMKSEAWMHNRARMITASFLVKHLFTDWRWGERVFMRSLLDGDIASNVGGWQWAAGTGTDAAPYFRIFNPTLQAKKHDPEGLYIRRWVPELREVPTRYIHAPWTMPDGVQAEVRCRIGRDYPEPVVDHAWARQRALDRFGRARDEFRANQGTGRE